MAGLVLATWSLERRRRQIDEIIAKTYKINYKNRISQSGITPLLRSFLRLRRLLRLRWGHASATASPLSLRELQPSSRLATPHWSALDEVSARLPSFNRTQKGLFIPQGEKQVPGVALP